MFVIGIAASRKYPTLQILQVHSHRKQIRSPVCPSFCQVELERQILLGVPCSFETLDLGCLAGSATFVEQLRVGSPDLIRV